MLFLKDLPINLRNQRLIQETDYQLEKQTVKSCKKLGSFQFSKKPRKKEVLEGDCVGFKSKKQAFLGSSLEKIFVEFVHMNLKI